MKSSKPSKISQKVRVLVYCAVLAALGAVLMLLDIPIAFYKLDLSLVPALMGGFAFGALPAVAISFVTQLINLLLDGTITGGVGELANFLISSCMALPAVLLYRKAKRTRGRVTACVVGVACMAAGGALLNYLVLIPAYVAALQIPEQALIGMAAKVIPSINSLGGLILMLTIPFNIVKGAISAVVAGLLYKRLGRYMTGGDASPSADLCAESSGEVTE